MPGPSSQSVKDILVAYSQKRATTEAVVRSLIAYRGWFAPVIWMARWRTGFETIVSFGNVTRFPPGEIWLFTDQEKAAVAANEGGHLGELGSYATEIHGGEIFRKLEGKWAININPGSPVEHRWYFGRDASALLSMWCDAVELEEALGLIPHPDADALMKLVLEYKWFLVLMRKADHGLVTFTDETRTEVAPLFTTNDNLDSFLAKFTPAEKDQVHSAHVRAGQVFDAARIDGEIGKIVINPFGPAPSRVFYPR